MQIDASSLPTIVLALCGCCLLGLILSFAFQILGIVGSLLGVIFDVIGGLIGGGPGVWCGCLAALGGIAVCGLLAYVIISGLQACGTPQATNLCTLFGR